jgi:hypothetical protein
MPNESRRAAAKVLLLALVWLGSPAWAAPAATTKSPGSDDATAATGAVTPTPPDTAEPAPTKKTKPSDATTAKEPDEFNPSESLSEDATVAYPVDI